MLSLSSHVITKLNENTLRPQTVTFPSWLDVSCQVTEFGNTLQITDYSYSFPFLYLTHSMQLFHANQRAHTFLLMGLYGISREWNNMFLILTLSWRIYFTFLHSYLLPVCTHVNIDKWTKNCNYVSFRLVWKQTKLWKGPIVSVFSHKAFALNRKWHISQPIKWLSSPMGLSGDIKIADNT